MGLASLYEPSAIVLPKEGPTRMAGAVTLPWEELAWLSQKSFTVGGYRPSQLGRDAPLAVRATTSLGFYRNGRREKSSVAVGRAVPVADIAEQKPRCRIRELDRRHVRWSLNHKRLQRIWREEGLLA